MTFFNKKEDVVKIELTPYGRRLLGKGQLIPMYYTFLDDNIIYNSEFAGFTENANVAKDRILKNTPYLRPQTNYKGVESSINTSNLKLSDNFNDDNLIPERLEKLQYALGKAPITSEKTPEISVTFLHGEVSSSALQYSGSGVAPVDIPQLECVIENTLEVKFIDKIQDFGVSNFRKSDGSYVEMTEREIIVHVQDLEGFNTSDNFSVEIFEYDSLTGSVLNPMKMQKEKPKIVNDILIDDSSERILYENNIYSNEYFTVVFDEEINRGKICQGIVSLKKENILTSLSVDCDDVALEGFEVDIYNSTTTNDDLEDC